MGDGKLREERKHCKRKKTLSIAFTVELIIFVGAGALREVEPLREVRHFSSWETLVAMAFPPRSHPEGYVQLGSEREIILTHWKRTLCLRDVHTTVLERMIDSVSVFVEGPECQPFQLSQSGYQAVALVTLLTGSVIVQDSHGVRALSEIGSTQELSGHLYDAEQLPTARWMACASTYSLKKREQVRQGDRDDEGEVEEETIKPKTASSNFSAMLMVTARDVDIAVKLSRTYSTSIARKRRAEQGLRTSLSPPSATLQTSWTEAIVKALDAGMEDEVEDAKEFHIDTVVAFASPIEHNSEAEEEPLLREHDIG